MPRHVSKSTTDSIMSKKPLAHTKRGKLLAVLGGIPGGPIGMVLSPLTLMLVNLVTRNKGDNINRFCIWALLGLIGIPASLIPTFALLLGTAIVLDPTVLDGGIPAPSDPPLEGEIDSYERNGAPKEWVECLKQKNDYNKCPTDKDLTRFGVH